jgi:hypothetical protein
VAELMRCKTCGYVMEAVKPGAVCPACGVPWKMMEPWKDPVSPKRRRLLHLDSHPIIDHFSISFVASALVLSLFVLVFPGLFRQEATALLQALVGVLPLAVIASFVTGLFDGKLRFRRTTAPLLVSKKVLGAVFLVLSVAAAVITFAASPYETWVRVADLFLMAGGVICGVGLGRIGGRLILAIFPG